MRILAVYNSYLNRGGEDEVFDTEASLLEQHGHEVLRYSKTNQDIDGLSPVHLGVMILWNRSVFQEIVEIVRARRPDVVHFHNTFPLISPAAYWAVKSQGVPVIQTLHNFRMLCPNALLYRQGRICEDCVGKPVAFPGVIHGCYQGSRRASAGVAAIVAFHRMLRTWRNKVDVYIALSEFARKKFIEGGLPSEKIVVKPNCLYPEPSLQCPERLGEHGLFVGRLSENKGIRVLLEAWRLLDGRLPLKIVGTGPLSDEVLAATRSIPNAAWLGRLPRAKVYELLETAAVMVTPSEWYEGMPMTIIEAYASGVPVIASRLGSMAAIVRDGETGMLFRPGDAQDLAARVRMLLDNPAQSARMRAAARLEFEQHYAPENNYRKLIEIYQSAIDSTTDRPA
jgi:glycosyltransferase involved in cell wall biosynthesis